jgi:ribokinase
MRLPIFHKPEKGTLVVGSNVIDLILHSETHFKIINQKYLGFPFDSKMKLDGFEVDVGGSAHNVAINLSNLGSKTMVFGAVGTSVYSNLILKNLADYGVDTTHIKKKDILSGISIVFIHKGEKTILTYRGANDLLGEKDFSEKMLKNVKRVVITSMVSPKNIRLVKKIAKAAEENLVYLVANPSMSMVENYPEELKYLLERSDCIIMNDKEAKAITKTLLATAAIKALSEYGAETVIVTCNSRGTLLYEEGQLQKIPAHKVKVVNTTGAGDSFTAGFIHAKNKNWESLEAVRFANALAALVIQTPGASVDLPDEREIIALMNRAPKK